MPTPRHPTLGIPLLGIGLGLRGPHYDEVLARKPDLGWFEVISENFMDTRGRTFERLMRVREHYPVALHGVSLNIGSPDPLDMDYLRRLSKLRDDLGAPWVSDHLCYTGTQGINTHQLLPVPYTDEMLRHIVARIQAVQDVLGARVLIENPSSYFEFTASTMHEADFLAAMSEEADCGLLLDVNNVYVSAFNHDLDPMDYLRRIPHHRVGQIHLAGHSHRGTHILDTHSAPVIDEVWRLFEWSWAESGGNANVMVEWDEDIPEFAVLEAEARKAEAVMAQVAQAQGGRRD